MDSQHIAVADFELLHGLGVVGHEAAIVVDVLGQRADAGLCLDELAQGFARRLGKHLEGDQVILLALVEIEDIESDAPIDCTWVRTIWLELYSKKGAVQRRGTYMMTMCEVGWRVWRMVVDDGISK